MSSKNDSLHKLDKHWYKKKQKNLNSSISIKEVESITKIFPHNDNSMPQCFYSRCVPKLKGEIISTYTNILGEWKRKSEHFTVYVLYLYKKWIMFIKRHCEDNSSKQAHYDKRCLQHNTQTSSIRIYR